MGTDGSPKGAEMSEYADKQWLRDHAKWYGEYDEFAVPTAEFIVAPKVEIVRCRDCIYWKGFCTNLLGLMNVDSDGYCSWGKEK